MCIGFQISNGFTNESDILVDTTTETTYTVTELTSSTDYTFIVKSKDEAGNLSAASDQETITTKPSAATN
jgi:chitodextrinase